MRFPVFGKKREWRAANWARSISVLCMFLTRGSTAPFLCNGKWSSLFSFSFLFFFCSLCLFLSYSLLSFSLIFIRPSFYLFIFLYMRQHQPTTWVSSARIRWRSTASLPQNHPSLTRQRKGWNDTRGTVRMAYTWWTLELARDQSSLRRDGQRHDTHESLCAHIYAFCIYFL